MVQNHSWKVDLIGFKSTLVIHMVVIVFNVVINSKMIEKLFKKFKVTT